MRVWMLSLLLLCPARDAALGLEWEGDPVVEFQGLLAGQAERQDRPSPPRKAVAGDELPEKQDASRFEDLMRKIEKGEPVEKAELDWARSNLGAGLAAKKVLIIVTSHDRLGNTGKKTGFWMEELAAPYLAFRAKGMAVDIASPKGGEPPADPASLANPPEAVKKFLSDQEAAGKLKSTLKLDKLPGRYDAYFVVGGHGVVWDLSGDAGSQKLLSESYEAGSVVAAVCHGPAALVNVRLKNGDPLVKGRKVGGFTNEEEKAAGLDAIVPFSLESTLKALGGLYQSGPMWGSFAVRDGRLVTGQNPASSEAVAEKAIEALTEELSKKLDSAKTK